MAVKLTYHLFFLCLFILPSMGYAARDVNHELQQLQKERQELAHTRRVLEGQLGSLNKALRKLDRSWVKAKRELTSVLEKQRIVSGNIKALRKKISVLKYDIARIKANMQQEAATAWRQAGRRTGWLDVLAGIPVTEIPHRQYILAAVLERQARDRYKLQQSIQSLLISEAALKDEQQNLIALRKQKTVVEATAKRQLRAKRSLARKVRNDVRLKKSRDATLALQQRGLHNLLKRIAKQALARKRAASRKPRQGTQTVIPTAYTIKGHIRKHRGRVPWPLRGKLVAHYGARLDQNRPKLKGVLIAPSSNSRNGRKVRVIANGVVRYADWFGGFGLMMIVEHSDGVMSIYAHNDALYKKIGNRVKAGDVISDAGSTGWIERVRLYFEMRDHGRVTNPERWCRS